jgi:hypothetical protein
MNKKKIEVIHSTAVLEHSREELASNCRHTDDRSCTPGPLYGGALVLLLDLLFCFFLEFSPLCSSSEFC